MNKMLEGAVCIHHYHIDDTNYGRCIKCGEEHQFPTVSEILLAVQRNPGVTIPTGYVRRTRSYSGEGGGYWDNLVKLYEG